MVKKKSIPLDQGYNRFVPNEVVELGVVREKEEPPPHSPPIREALVDGQRVLIVSIGSSLLGREVMQNTRRPPIRCGRVGYSGY